MIDRQRRILRILLELERDFISIHDLSEQVGCSEKTIRNDFKIIDDWLRFRSTAKIVRKPNIGVYLQADRSEKQWLLKELTQYPIEDADRMQLKFNILYNLLKEGRHFTIQELSEKFFVSKPLIRKELDEIQEWLLSFQLKLIRKQNSGIKVEGDEKNWRAAYADVLKQLSQTYHQEDLFLPYEYGYIKSCITRMDSPFPFTDEAIHDLTIHMLTAIQRIKQGHIIPIPVEMQKRVQETNEFQMAQNLVQQLSQVFSIAFPPQEVAYFALHFLGARIRFDFIDSMEEYNEPLKQLNPLALEFSRRLIQEMSQAMDEAFSNDRELFVSLAVHLHSTIHRLQNEMRVFNPVLHQVKKMFRYTFELLMNIAPKFETEFHIRIPEEEIAYLVLHFQASLERINKKNAYANNILLICPFGTGMSQLIKTKLKRKFHSLNIVGTTSVSNLSKAIHQQKPDAIISTVPVSETSIPTIVVSPFLAEEELEKLARFFADISMKKKGKPKYPIIQSFLCKELIKIDVDCTDRDSIVALLAELLAQKGRVSPNYQDSARKRESASSTAIGGGIAIPHGNPEEVYVSSIAAAKLKRPINWDGEKVQFVFMLAIHPQEKLATKELFTELIDLAEDKEFLEHLKRLDSVDQFLSAFLAETE